MADMPVGLRRLQFIPSVGSIGLGVQMYVADPFSRHPAMTRVLAATMTWGRLKLKNTSGSDVAAPVQMPASVGPRQPLASGSSTSIALLDVAAEREASCSSGVEAAKQLSLLEKDISRGYAFATLLC